MIAGVSGNKAMKLMDFQLSLNEYARLRYQRNSCRQASPSTMANKTLFNGFTAIRFLCNL